MRPPPSACSTAPDGHRGISEWSQSPGETRGFLLGGVALSWRTLYNPTMDSITATEAKKIGQLMDRVVQSGEPVAIRRSGRPQVVVVPWRKWNEQAWVSRTQLGQTREQALADCYPD